MYNFKPVIVIVLKGKHFRAMFISEPSKKDYNSFKINRISSSMKENEHKIRLKFYLKCF